LARRRLAADRFGNRHEGAAGVLAPAANQHAAHFHPQVLLAMLPQTSVYGRVEEDPELLPAAAGKSRGGQVPFAELADIRLGGCRGLSHVTSFSRKPVRGTMRAFFFMEPAVPGPSRGLPQRGNGADADPTAR